MSRGATEETIEKIRDPENSDLPARTRAALRYADHVAGDPGPIAGPLVLGTGFAAVGQTHPQSCATVSLSRGERGRRCGKDATR